MLHLGSVNVPMIWSSQYIETDIRKSPITTTENLQKTAHMKSRDHKELFIDFASSNQQHQARC